MFLFGGSAVAIAHMSESGVPESSSFDVVWSQHTSCEVLSSKLQLISSLARKRKISSNPARAKRSKGAVVKSISSAHRIKDFPNEHLTVYLTIMLQYNSIEHNYIILSIIGCFEKHNKKKMGNPDLA